ncbi:MAG: GatB/YqeY domain-containing protein [Actinobacteria bacterium]|nr:GatB/YqeY domain-containing protein [Actinomycetota bacterium]
MSLQQRIQSDLTEAMKARNSRRVSALRMVIAAMKNAAIEQGKGPQGQLEDDSVEAILASEVKKRREAAEAFRGAGREEQAAGEEAEAEIYATYLPEPLSDEELKRIVDGAIAEVAATSPKEMGQVMKTVMAQVGNRAEGARISALVKDKLTG